MNSERRRALAGAMLAYVDDCLVAPDRAALEEQMRAYPEIKGRIEEWRAQNAAIRAAFPDPTLAHAAHPVGAPLSGRRANDQAQRARRAVREQGALVSPPPPAAEPAPAVARRSVAPATRARTTPTTGGALALAGKLLAAVIVAFALWTASAIVLAKDPAAGFGNAATAAYRTFIDNGARPVEIATSDRETARKWIAAQIVGAAAPPDLAAAGWALLGARIVPGAASPAAFLVYENGGRERLALQIESADSPPEAGVAIRDSAGLASASWTSAGRGFALVGRAPRARLAELARFIRKGWPAT